MPDQKKNQDKTRQIAEIRRQPIELCQLLKTENLVQSGGEAKFVISGGLVRVNGAVETRKRRKIMNGDTVSYADQTLEVRLRSET